MPRPRRTLFAAPLVFTVALTPSCSRHSGERTPTGTATESPPTPPPTPDTTDVPPGSAATTDAAAADADRIVFNGYQCLKGPPGKESSTPCPDSLLPDAPPNTAVAEQNGECRTLERKRVKCPPTIVLPEPAQLDQNGTRIAIDTRTFGCHTWEEMHCPPGARCNPPPPEAVACPPELLPRLAAGVQPTARKDGHCYLGDVIVVCPAK